MNFAIYSENYIIIILTKVANFVPNLADLYITKEKRGLTADFREKLLIFNKDILKHLDELSININNSILVDMYL